MPERLRALLDRPLGPSAARAVLALASAVFVGFGAVALLGASIGSTLAPRAERGATSAPSSIRPALAPRLEVRPKAGRQDPQDRRGSGAARAAWGELRRHRALQHVPYRRGGLSISLVGARRGRAVLRVRAADLPAARRGWRAFLRRFGDDGRAYRPVFDSERSRG